MSLKQGPHLWRLNGSPAQKKILLSTAGCKQFCLYTFDYIALLAH